LLIISVSGAGIYTCFELIKYVSSDPILRTNQYVINTPVQVTGALLTLAIIVNFISQWTAYIGSSIAIDSTKSEIHSRENGTFEQDKSKIDGLDKKAAKYQRATKYTNILSTGLMIIGLIVLTGFLLHLF
jgi:hypothetical protein